VKHPAVANCAVVPTPDETRGTVVKAFDAARARILGLRIAGDSLREHVKQSLAAPQPGARSVRHGAADDDDRKKCSGKC
jgi:acyl-coenzyme A synthetase/AMP-(fatty) acid ligase